MFAGGPGGLTISGYFDEAPSAALSDFDITVSGFGSTNLTNVDGGNGFVNPPAFEFVDYVVSSINTQQLTFAGTLGGPLPSMLGQSVPFSGTYDYKVISVPVPFGDQFTAQGSVTALAYVVPEPVSAHLLLISSALMFLLKIRSVTSSARGH